MLGRCNFVLLSYGIVSTEGMIHERVNKLGTLRRIVWDLRNWHDCKGDLE